MLSTAVEITAVTLEAATQANEKKIMDPNACLRIINDATRINAEAREACGNLYHWLQTRGFQPDWAAYPRGTKRFERWLKSTGRE